MNRRSILELADNWEDVDVVERPIPMDELARAGREGRLREIFCCGTAALVQPVGQLLREADGEVIAPRMNGTEPNALTLRCHKVLSDIQYYRLPHREWSVPFE